MSNNKYKTYGILLIIILLLPANLYIGYKILTKANNNNNIEPVLQLSVYKDLTNEYTQLNKKLQNKKLIVFIGDSITKRFNLSEYFPNKPIINRGIYSDTTVGLLKRLSSSLEGLTIDKIFILIGYNDLSIRSNKKIVQNIRTILKQVKAKEIYLQSILPVDHGWSDLNTRINAINRELITLCAETGARYLDIHSLFQSQKGGIRPELSTDGVHPNGAGYQIWQKAVAAVLFPES